jgi:hypothetical protein
VLGWAVLWIFKEVPVPVLGKKFRINFFFGSVLVSLKKKIQNWKSIDFLVLWKKKKKKKKKNQNWRIVHFWFSQKIKEPMVFDKEPAKKTLDWFLEFLIFFWKNFGYIKIKNWLFENSENWWVSGFVCTRCDNRRVSFLNSNTGPTLVFYHGYQNPPVWGFCFTQGRPN